MRFLYLVQQHCREEREVAWYADKLCVTPKYLSAICQKMTGKADPTGLSITPSTRSFYC